MTAARNARLVQVVASQARQLTFAGQGPVTLINRDLTSLVYLGDDEGFDAAGQSVTPLDPLSFHAVDGKDAIWAKTLAGQTATVAVRPGGQSWAPSPAQQAAQIALLNLAQETGGNLATHTALLSGTQAGALLGVAGNTIGKEIAAWLAGGAVGATPGGVPLLTNANVIANATASNIAAGGSATAGPFAVTQPGYECRFDIQDHTSAVAQSFVKIQFNWIDSGTGLTVLAESFVVAAGPNATAHILRGRGPSAANQLSITFFNAGASGDAVDVTYRIWQNSRLYTRSDLRSDSLAAAGFTLPTFGMDQDIIGSMSPPTLATGASWTRIMAFYCGTVSLYCNTASATTDGEFAVAGIAAAFGLASFTTLFDQFTGSKGNVFGSLVLPRFQTVVTATNHNAATQVLAATMVVNEQKV